MILSSCWVITMIRPYPARAAQFFSMPPRPDYTPTEGCVALALTDLQGILGRCGTETRLRVHPMENG